MNNFKEKLMEIVFDNSTKYAGNGAAILLVKLVQNRAKQEGCDFAQAAEALSNEPDFGKNGEAGGVNVNRQTGVGFIDSGEEYTWMTLEALVDATLDGGHTPNLWDAEWTTGKTNEELEKEKAKAKAAFRDGAKRERFESFGTGKPIVNIEYFYDKKFMYEKRGNVTTKAEITAKQLSALNALHFNESIEAAHIFNEASGGRSHAPI